ncbi:MAG: GatB/YqeY domain-containing protein [Candidatus Omnitrophica bacterium]|nr:GatB/YqeY domain-containing protein [Candidatus Omnitrophota bacterium]
MLEKKITEDLAAALKAKDKTKVSVLRMVLSEIKNKKIAERVDQLGDQQVISVIQKMARKHKESIEQFKKGERQDLVDKESAEMKVLDEYLPEQLPEEELIGIINEAIDKTGASSPRDMGKVMGEVLGRVSGRADGKTVSRIVKEKLS